MASSGLSGLVGNWNPLVLGACVVILLAVRAFYLSGSKTKLPFPPGPKGAPVIGNLRQVPAARSDIQFAKWAKEFSESSHHQSSPILQSPIQYLTKQQNPTSSMSISWDSPSWCSTVFSQRLICLRRKRQFTVIDQHLLQWMRTATISSNTISLTRSRSLGFRNNPGLVRDNAQYRKLRKAFGGLSPGNSLTYRQHQLKHARTLATEIGNHPEKWQNLLSR